jgi:transmembrane sensor
VLMVIALGIIIELVVTPRAGNELKAASGNRIVKQDLPDGSKVILNKHTHLTFIHENNRREIRLTGEAFFEVKHNEAQPFVIRVHDLSITDIGTAFNVRALPATDSVEVTVEEGVVELKAPGNANLVLSKGERAIYLKGPHILSRHAIDPYANRGSYGTGKFSFRNARLNDVIAQFNAAYDTDIRLAEAHLGDCRLTVSFSDEQPDVMLEIIAETLELKIKRDGQTVVLSGAPCR